MDLFGILGAIAAVLTLVQFALHLFGLELRFGPRRQDEQPDTPGLILPFTASKKSSDRRGKFHRIINNWKLVLSASATLCCVLIIVVRVHFGSASGDREPGNVVFGAHRSGRAFLVSQRRQKFRAGQTIFWDAYLRKPMTVFPLQVILSRVDNRVATQLTREVFALSGTQISIESGQLRAAYLSANHAQTPGMYELQVFPYGEDTLLGNGWFRLVKKK
jgi:hypothetical protein